LAGGVLLKIVYLLVRQVLGLAVLAFRGDLVPPEYSITWSDLLFRLQV
jgi:hypothetical protein